MPRISKRRCTGAEWFSRSSTGQRFSLRCPLRENSGDAASPLSGANPDSLVRHLVFAGTLSGWAATTLYVRKAQIASLAPRRAGHFTTAVGGSIRVTKPMWTRLLFDRSKFRAQIAEYVSWPLWLTTAPSGRGFVRTFQYQRRSRRAYSEHGSHSLARRTPSGVSDDKPASWNARPALTRSQRPALGPRLHTGELKIAAALSNAGTLAEELKDFQRKVSDAGRAIYKRTHGRP